MASDATNSLQKLTEVVKNDLKTFHENAKISALENRSKQFAPHYW